MKLNQNTNDNSMVKVNRNMKKIENLDIENLNYLYPYGHRTTNQMRWFKGSRDRGLKSDIAA